MVLLHLDKPVARFPYPGLDLHLQAQHDGRDVQE